MLQVYNQNHFHSFLTEIPDKHKEVQLLQYVIKIGKCTEVKTQWGFWEKFGVIKKNSGWPILVIYCILIINIFINLLAKCYIIPLAFFTVEFDIIS